VLFRLSGPSRLERPLAKCPGQVGIGKSTASWITLRTNPGQAIHVFEILVLRVSWNSKALYILPQGSILGPVIFNLYVANFQSELQCDCYQYADDTTFYVHSKPCDLDASADHINRTITSLREYSESCNLALNPSKTNWMLISTPQMARYHSLEERKLPIACGDTSLKRISCTKLLGVYMDQHLTWNTHLSRPCAKFIVRDSVSTAQA